MPLDAFMKTPPSVKAMAAAMVQTTYMIIPPGNWRLATTVESAIKERVGPSRHWLFGAVALLAQEQEMIRLPQRKRANSPRRLGDVQVRVAELADRVGQGIQRPAIVGLTHGCSQPPSPLAHDLDCRGAASRS